MQVSREWFGEWFNSPYYHILYKHRDYNEARGFINNLNALLDFKPSQKILDLACGKGRHAIYLNSKGMDVIGIDLSPKNIAQAKQYENERLHFYVHDMREIFAKEEFDFVLNLFTSFGYFDTNQENEAAICATATALKPKGAFVIDYLNPQLAINNMIPCEEKWIEGIHFKISRKFSAGYILKDIEFEAEGKVFYFQEKVQAIQKEEFIRYFEQAGLVLNHIYGDYDLHDFHEDTSHRMIFVLQKMETGKC